MYVNIRDYRYEFVNLMNEKSCIRNIHYQIYRTNLKNSYQICCDTKRYNKIKRRIYNTINNIIKLKEGKIKKYQIYNELEYYIYKEICEQNNILFNIYSGYYYYYQKPEKFENFISICREYPEFNRLNNTYFCVYKGFVNLIQEPQKFFESKFKINLFSL
jgi:hypothetical protein